MRRRLHPHAAPTAAVLALTTAASLAAGDILHVPNDYPELEDAVAVSASGDTIVVAEGLWGVPDTLRIPAGVTLTSEGRPELTEIEIGYDRIVLEAGPDTTRLEDLTFVCAYEDGATVSMESFNPHTLIRRVNFLDIFLGGDTGTTLLMHAGGVVEHSAFNTTAYSSLVVDGGDSTLVRYNTWSTSCQAAGTGALEIEDNPRKIEFRNNTVILQTLELHPQVFEATTVNIVNNVFLYVNGYCGGSQTFSLFVTHNYLYEMDFFNCDTLAGPGNIVVEGFPDHPIFCDSASCSLTVHSDFPGVEAGENGETMGAWPIGCGTIPVDPDPTPSPILPLALVGYPTPTPSSNSIELYVGLPTTRIGVYDAAGRHVRQLSARSQPSWARWDGRTDDGRLAPSGVYFVRVEAHDGRVAVRRVQILR